MFLTSTPPGMVQKFSATPFLGVYVSYSMKTVDLPNIFLMIRKSGHIAMKENLQKQRSKAMEKYEKQLEKSLEDMNVQTSRYLNGKALPGNVEQRFYHEVK